MSPSVKANIGPAKTHPCDSCGVHVSPSWAFVVGLSAVAGAGFISAVSRPDYAISLLIATAVIVFTLIFRYSQRVPLVRRNPQAS